MEYARAQFKLSRRMDDGRTYRDTLIQVAPHSVAARLELEELEAVQLPACAEHVWDWFAAAAERKTQSGFGPSLLTWQDARAWMEVTGVRPRRHELDLMLALDRLYLQDAAEHAAEKPKGRRA